LSPENKKIRKVAIAMPLYTSFSFDQPLGTKHELGSLQTREPVITPTIELDRTMDEIACELRAFKHVWRCSDSCPTPSSRLT
jgi:hypothetical protein